MPPWIKFALLLAFPFAGLAAVDKMIRLGWFLPRCPECRTRMKVETTTLREPTAETAGVGMHTRRCPSCGYRDQRRFTIDKYEGATHGDTLFGVYLRWRREDWTRVSEETLQRSKRDSTSRHGD